jgi:hypothetical protein
LHAIRLPINASRSETAADWSAERRARPPFSTPIPLLEDFLWYPVWKSNFLAAIIDFYDGYRNIHYLAADKPRVADTGVNTPDPAKAPMDHPTLTPKEIKEGIEFVRTTSLYQMPLEEVRELYRKRFGDAPIAKEVVNGVVNAQDTSPDFNMIKLYELARIRGAEMLPWIEPLLTSKEPREYGHAACGLLHIDEPRGIEEAVRLYELCAWTGSPGCGFSAGWFTEELNEINSPACLEAVKRIEKLIDHMVYVRYRISP